MCLRRHEAARSSADFGAIAARLRFLAAYDAALERWPTSPRHRDVPTTFGTTHVLQSGPAAGTPIVLLHAIAVSSPAWYPDIAALSASHPVYAIDTITDPGRSTQSAPVRNGEDFAAWLTEVLGALHLAACIVVGLSYGGWLALNQAHRSPNGIASVTSVDPVGALGRARTSFMIKIVPDSLLALAKSEKAIHRLMARLNNGAVPEQPLLDLSVAGLRTFVAKQPFPKRMTDEELRRITVPTLLLLCARSPGQRRSTSSTASTSVDLTGVGDRVYRVNRMRGTERSDVWVPGWRRNRDCVEQDDRRTCSGS